MTDQINSLEYWENRFESDWEILCGWEQSRFFANLALQLMPDWLVSDIRVGRLSVCDWGCAEGDGTQVLADYFRDSSVVGIDFSHEAVKRAAAKYPECRFDVVDLLKDANFSESFDVFFSSNTLEHFHEPWEVLERLSKYAWRYIVLLLPFEEQERIDEHFYTFECSNIPFYFADGSFMLAHRAVIDVSDRSPTYWPGKQILLVYARLNREDGMQNGKKKIDQLAALLFENQRQFNESIAKIDALQASTSSLEQRLRDSLQNLVERLDELSAANQRAESLQWQIDVIHGSRSWWLTRPLRAAARMLRQGGSGLYGALRSLYWRLPERLRVELTPLRYRAVAKLRHRLMAQGSAPREESGSNPDWVEFANAASRVAVVPCAFEFDELVNQRPINLAKYLAERGYAVLFVAWQWSADEVLGKAYQTVYPRVIEVPLFDFLGHASALHWKEGATDALYFLMLPAEGLVRLLPVMRGKGFAIIYDIMDEWEEFKRVGQAPWHRLEVEERAVLEADVVCGVSAPLVEKFRYLRKDLFVNGNGFTPAVIGLNHEGVAAHYDGTGQIVAGYFGHLTDAWFDWQSLIVAALAAPDIRFEIIGYGVPDHIVERVQALPNVSLIGKVPPTELHRYVRGWHVGLIPFKGSALSAAVDPIKVYEYLYLGLPTVVMGISHLASYPGVRLAASGAELVMEVREQAARGLRGESGTADLDAFLKATTWSARFERLLKEVEEQKGLYDCYAH